MALVLGLFLFISISVFGIIKYTKDLPDYKQLKEYTPSIISRLYTGNGTLLAEFSAEKRVFTPIQSIPEIIKKAFVSAEDKNFYYHKGVDLQSISKAVLINIKNLYEGKRLVGASTITQQLAKNFLLSNEVSLNRKIREALLALRIERILTKDDILELYLNEIFLGKRSYGIAAAALNYFNKSLDELDLHEVAYLAGLPKGPNNYDPIKNKKAAIIRRNYVLNRMFEDGAISNSEASKASMQPMISSNIQKVKTPYAPYFIEEVRRNIIEKYGETSLYREGLNVITTIDPKLQKIAINELRGGLENYDKRHGWRGPLENLDNNDLESLRIKYKNFPGLHDKIAVLILEIDQNEMLVQNLQSKNKFKINVDNVFKSKWLNNGEKKFEINNINSFLKKNDIIILKKYKENNIDNYKIDQIPEVNGAIVVIDPRNGRVLALSGGYDFDGSEFNRATQAYRQPGSAFKPFVYLAALESGYLPNTKILDAPLVIDQGPGLEKWKPKNYSGMFYGPSTLRVGLEKSRNVMTVRLANEIGMKKIVEISKRFRLGDFPPLLASSLGSEETTLLNLAAAYSAFVNGGRYNKPALIEKIQNRNGKVIFRRDSRACNKCEELQINNFVRPILFPEGEKIIDSNHAFQLTWMLKGVTTRGTAKSLNKLDLTIAGKTGTTNDNMDAWFLGFSPEYVVGVFVGYDSPKSLGDKETGGKVAAPIFAEFMKKALDQGENRPFLVPEGIEMIKIDYLSGKKAIDVSKNVIFEAFIKNSYISKNKDVLKEDTIINDFESNLY
ncbi:penicillin-binding protein 1A [Alphaproteobacteria bacterium]|nr:penicillin-binding protein 1A [Alphaproteobacteria bacterium]